MPETRGGVDAARRRRARRRWGRFLSVTTLLDGVRSGIGRRLTVAFVAAALLAGVGIGVANYLIARDALLEEVRGRLPVLARSRQAAITDLVDGMERAVSFLATSPWLPDAIAEFRGRLERGSDDTPGSALEARAELMRRFALDRKYRDLFLTDETGRVVHAMNTGDAHFGEGLDPERADASPVAGAFAGVLKNRVAGRVVFVDFKPDSTRGGADVIEAAIHRGEVEPRGRVDQQIRPLSAREDLFNARKFGLGEEAVRRSTAGRYLSIGGSPMPRGGLVAVLTDHIRQEYSSRLARDAAEDAARAKASFLATTSHEIRTPMNGVLSMATLLEQTELDDERRSMLTIRRQSAESPLTVINDILDFSKIEAGRLAIERIPMSLIDTAEGAVDLVSPRAMEKGIELALDIEIRRFRIG